MMIYRQGKALAISAVIVSALFAHPVFATNDAMKELLQVLRDNGTISEEAYSVLKNSVEADAERSHAEIEKNTDKKIAKMVDADNKTKWAEKIKLKGDLRLRREYSKVNDADDSDDPSRTRYRYRLRLGAEGKVNDDVKVGLGLASGSDDPTSTNETLDDTFSTKDIRVDYAYAEWQPMEHAKVVAGKFKRKSYLWAPTDLLWDGDINPEGLSVHFENKNTAGKTYVNAGIWILDEESGSKDDPFMKYIQLGHKFKVDNVYGNVAGTLYRFDDVEGEPLLDHVRGSNTVDADGNYQYDYDSLGLSAELGLKDVFMPGKIFAVFGDYIKNSDSKEDKGYAVGFKFGDKKVRNRHQWQFKYIYADLEQDAFLDNFPDSDRFGGQTAVKGNEFIFNYGLHKNVVFGIDYYDSELDVPESAHFASDDNDKQKVLQTDVVFKF